MKSAARTFDLFETFAKMQTPLSLSDLARQMKMPVSTCFNLVRTFESRGFLYSLGSRRGLYPTKRMLI
jgi:IclR family acetate operon transcriptional repressor